MNCNICGMPDFSGHVCDEKRIEKILFQLGRNTGKSLLCAEKAKWVINEYTKKKNLTTASS